MTDAIKLLIIDDSEDDRLLYRRALGKSATVEYTLLEAESGESGLAIMNEDLPDCILLDYSLPGRNGVEVLKRIRSQYPYVPVIMLTGQGNEKVAVSAIQEGAQNYISKSTITHETLEHVITMAIEHCMMHKRIHDQQASLEVFTHALAHDLKEPVRTIRSFVELLEQREPMSDKASKYFHYIQKAADRMHILIDTVFLYTRLADPTHVTKEACDLQVVMQEVKENLHRLIRDREASITHGSLPIVYANHIQMVQLLQNLFCNAINHSDEPVKIHVRTTAEGADWCISVADDGPGIDAGHLTKIFEPFKRLNSTEEGTGLGLAICQKILESHGGKIWCESPPGKGAVFTFTMPRTMPISPNAPRVGLHFDGEYCSIGEAGDKPLANVLLVDDSKADIEMTRFRLLERSQLKCNLLVAHDGEEALNMMHKGVENKMPVDLLLLDINMPQMDGFELLERIRRDHDLDKTVVVMCTGSIYDKDMERARSLGAAGYITKPIEFSKLRATIEHNTTFQLCPAEDGFALLRRAA